MLSGTAYFPISEDVVVSSLVEGGYIFGFGQPVNIADRFFLGGDTFPGFRVAGIGPRDSIFGDSLGGNQYYRGTTDVGFPVGLPEEYGIKGHAFAYYGALSKIDQSQTLYINPTTGGIANSGQPDTVLDSSGIRVSAGIGVSWKSPFGPIRIDVAYPVVKQPFDKTQILRVQLRHQVLGSRVRLSLKIVLSVFVLATPVLAEPAPPAAPIIAVVNVQKIIHESAAGKGLDVQYDKAHQSFADGVSKQEHDLDAQEQELNRQRTVLTPAAFNTQRQALENHSAEVQRAIQQGSQANQLAFNDAFASLVNTIRSIVTAVAKEQGVTVVMPQEQTLYLGPGAVDITDTVLTRVDAKLPSITVALPKADAAANVGSSSNVSSSRRE